MSAPFTVGIDIVSVRRMAQAIERQGSRFLDRVFTKEEQRYCERKRMKYENYAGRFAVKEAFIKAIKGGRGRYSFSKIEVVRDMRGAPSIHLDSDAQKLFRVPGNAKFEVSITHEREFAVGVVVLFKS